MRREVSPDFGDHPIAMNEFSAGLPTFTREARIYAIREIARRAGVSGELFKSWRIETDPSATTVYVSADRQRKIRFPFRPLCDLGELPSFANSVLRATWTFDPPEILRKSTPDFVVPFTDGNNHGETLPVFELTDSERIRFNFDLPTAAIWTLSRVEETLVPEHDTHGRFPASASVATQKNFLQRPIVDEYGFALEQALRCLLPGWSPERRRFRVKLSHDLDDVGIPFSLRTAIGHTLRRRSLRATFQDMLASVTARNPAHLSSVFQIARLSKEHCLDSAFYWKASPPGKNDNGYDPRHAKLKGAMTWLTERGFESGVHPGYDTFGSTQKLKSEVDVLRRCIGNYKLGGRQHYLRWNPETWRHWEACGLAYDSTVGFADRIGFRAGTCIPYRPWLFSENREADLIEIPLLVMDRTLGYYMRLATEKSFTLVLDCIERCRSVGGVFTMLWHNDAVLDPIYGDLYSRVLRHLSGAPQFEWNPAF